MACTMSHCLPLHDLPHGLHHVPSLTPPRSPSWPAPCPIAYPSTISLMACTMSHCLTPPRSPSWPAPCPIAYPSTISLMACTMSHYLPLHDLPHGLHHEFEELRGVWVEYNLRWGEQGFHCEQRLARLEKGTVIQQVVSHHLDKNKK